MQIKSTPQQYYLDKLGLDRYQLKPLYAPKKSLCIIGMQHWSTELRALGEAIITAVTHYCPDCNLHSLSTYSESSDRAPNIVLLSAADYVGDTTGKVQVFVIEQLLDNANLKRSLWQSCIHG